MDRSRTAGHFCQEGPALGDLVDVVAWVTRVACNCIRPSNASSVFGLSSFRFDGWGLGFDFAVRLFVAQFLGRARHDGSWICCIQRREQDVDRAPWQLTVLVPFATKAPRSICPFAGCAHRRLGVEGLRDAVGLPLHHTNRHGLVNESTILVKARIIYSYAYIRRRPGRRSMSAPYSTHIPRLEVLLALRANRQSRIGELDV